MAKIIDPDLLNVGTELTINTTLKTITLNAAGNLVAKDGVSLQALYSKLIELWASGAGTYNRFPFPLYTIDSRSGQFIWGFDGSSYNGWRLADDTSRQMVRDAGWSEYSAAGALNRQYVGVIALASGFPAGSQFYFQRVSGGAALNFTFTDAPNEAIQVFGDATNGNFDNKTYFKIFCREYEYTYDDAVLGDIGENVTGSFKISLPISVGSDLKIQANDAAMSGAPYSSINITYFGTDQSRSIGGTNYPFRIIIDGANATAEQIYTKVQYLLRQNSDIDAGAGTITGKTANSLLSFVGDTLYTTQGVFIDNYNSNDINRIVFTDQNSVQRTFPFTAAGSLNFNSFLTQGGTGYYRMYFSTLPGSTNDFGESGAVTVQNASATDIQGSISAASIPFTFAYDTNTQGGRTAGTDAQVTVVAGNVGNAKPVVTTYTITRATGQSISLVAEQDRGYLT